MVGSSDSQSELSSTIYVSSVSKWTLFINRGILFEEIPKTTRIIIRVVYRADKNETYIHPLIDL